MLLNLHKRRWSDGLVTHDHVKHATENETTCERLAKLAAGYNDRLSAELTKTDAELAIEHVGKIDPKKHLTDRCSELMASNISQSLGTLLATVVF